MNTPDTTPAAVEPLNESQLIDLIERFGAAMFDCGEHDEPIDHDGYDKLCEKTDGLRMKIRSVLRALLAERDELRARLDAILADPGYVGGVQHWIEKHDERTCQLATAQARVAELEAEAARGLRMLAGNATIWKDRAEAAQARIAELEQTLLDVQLGSDGLLKTAHTREARLREALERLVKLDDDMNDPENPDKGTYSGAYYAYYKGCSQDWQSARAALAATHDQFRDPTEMVARLREALEELTNAVGCGCGADGQCKRCCRLEDEARAVLAAAKEVQP